MTIDTKYPRHSAAAKLCEFCKKQRGWGNHEEWCRKNPINLARRCEVKGCSRPGCCSSHGTRWICEAHSELECARSFLKSRKNSVDWAEMKIRDAEKALVKAKNSLPIAEQKLKDAEEHYERVQFKARLDGIIT